MGDINNLQRDHDDWVTHNFPNQERWEPLLGLAEEVGELSHAVLKRHRGIRGDATQLTEKEFDAIGDIFIYLMSFCNASGYNLEECVEVVWEEVSSRNWVAYPKDGQTE